VACFRFFDSAAMYMPDSEAMYMIGQKMPKNCIKSRFCAIFEAKIAKNVHRPKVKNTAVNRISQN